MVAIPQITREKLASSVIGTPGVDTSGQKIGEDLASSANQVGGAIADYAINRQQNLDLAEKNRLDVDYKLKTLDDLDTIKTRYANNPEGAGPALVKASANNLKAVQAQASNPRVALAVGQGDPYFNTHILMNQQQWAYKQRDNLNVQSIQNQGNSIADHAEDLGRNAPSLTELQEGLKPLASATGSLLANTAATVSPESAAKLQAKMLPTLYSRAFYGSLQDNPARAYALTQDKDMQAAFAANPKELDGMTQQAMKRVQGMAKEEEWKQMITPLVDSPQIINQVASGKVDWNQIRSFPDGPYKDQLEKMALAGPSINTTEKAEAVANFFADAHSMGMQMHQVPSGKSMADLVKFNTELTAAHNDGLVTPATYQTMMNKLAIPLRDSMLKVHDPDTLKKINSQDWLGHFLHPQEQPDQVIDKYVGGYNTINNWLKSQGKDQDWEYKAGAIQKYMTLSDNTKSEDRDFYGRPWTPANLARKAMGIGDGDTIQTVFGPKQITGATDKGIPKYEITKEEQDKLNHLAALNRK